MEKDFYFADHSYGLFWMIQQKLVYYDNNCFDFSNPVILDLFILFNFIFKTLIQKKTVNRANFFHEFRVYF